MSDVYAVCATTRSYVCKIINTHTYIHTHNLIVGPQGGGWGEAEASRAPSITPLSERRSGREGGLGGLLRGRKRGVVKKKWEGMKEKRKSDGNEGER